MRIQLKLLLLLTFHFNIVNAQTAVCKELQEMIKGHYKTFESDGTGKALGLKFSIQYPTNYQRMPDDLTGAVVGFSPSIQQGGGFRIVIDKLPNGWKDTYAKRMGIPKEKAKAYPLSERILRQHVTGDAKFLNSKNGFIVAGVDAAYYDFLWKGKLNSGDNIFEYMTLSRVYIFYYKDYEVRLVFTKSGLSKYSSVIEMEFNKYKQFFSYIAYTFIPLS